MRVIEVSPTDVQATNLIRELDILLNSLYPPESNHLDSVETLTKENVTFVGIQGDGVLAAIGAVKLVFGATIYGELKRIYTKPEYRNRGCATLLIQELENCVRLHNIESVRLETGVKQDIAIKLFTKLGYKKRDAFFPYEPDSNSVFMEKNLY